MSTRNQPAAVPLCLLVARESELERLVQMWRTSRFVTLYGQSGVGKSALAAAAADRMAEEPSTSVVCLDARQAEGRLAVLRLLARARRRRSPLLPPAATQALESHSGTSADAPRTASPPPFYVLLDHLRTAAHDAVRGIVEWLVEHPEVHLLVVSRRPLDVPGEQTLSLAPLSVSGSDGVLPPAVQLFDWGSRGAQQGESAVPRGLAAAIGEALGGLPAAVEAAAALVGALPASEILRIAREKPLSLSLRGGALHSMLQATWGDLQPEAREYLHSNAVWPASFSNGAGEHLAGPAANLAVTSGLVRQGLLRIATEQPEIRYQLSPLVRHLALAEAPERRDGQLERMAECLFDQAVRTSLGDQVGCLHPDDLSAMRLARRGLAGRGGGAGVRGLALALAGPLRRQMGEAEEAAELLQSALSHTRAADSDHTTLQSQLAATERALGHLDQAEQRLRELIAAPLSAGARAVAVLRLAAVLSDRGQHTAAMGMRQEAIQMLRNESGTGNGKCGQRTLAWALHGLAGDHRHLGQTGAAGTAIEEANALFSRLDSPCGRAACMLFIALLHLEADEHEEAAWQAQESLRLSEIGDDRPGRARSLQVQARIIGRDDPARGLAVLEEATGLWRQCGEPAGLIRSLLDQAEIARIAGLPADRLIQPARDALRLACRHGYRTLEAAALLLMAEGYQYLGREELARDFWQQARVACEATDALWVRQRCRAAAVPTRPQGPQRKSSRLPARPAGPEQEPAAPAGPPLTIRLLGALRVEGPAGVLTADRLRPKEQRILARLALEPGRLVLRDELLETFWPNSKMVAAERSLRTVVSCLRGAMRSVLRGPAPALIRGRMDGYCLEQAACGIDVSWFIEAVQEARNASHDEESPDPALAAWQRAVDLYQGDLLSAFRYDDWCLAIRERLRDDYLDGLFQLARAALAAGSLERGRELAARMVEQEPAEERAHRLLMRCYALLGRRAEAIRQFEHCRAALWEELGARPGTATRELLETLQLGTALDAAALTSERLTVD